MVILLIMPAPKGNKNAKGNAGGRPTLYKEEYNQIAYVLCLRGATDAELADTFGVEETTINNWKLEHVEFFESIKRGKSYADAVIANSLYERAKGCKIKKQTAIKLATKTPVKNAAGEPTRIMKHTERVEVVDLEEEIPPDTTAMIFWLKNRQPKEWRDKQEIDHTTGGEKLDFRPRIIPSDIPTAKDEKDVQL